MDWAAELEAPDCAAVIVAGEVLAALNGHPEEMRPGNPELCDCNV